MKKIFIYILSIVFLLIGTLSVMALDGYDKSSSTKEQKNIEVKASEPTFEDVADITSLNAQKEVVFNNLLNCIDYYNAVKGSFETSLIDDTPVAVAYEVDIPKQISYESVKGSNLDLEIFSHDGTITEVNKIERNYHEERFIPQYDENTRRNQTANIYEKVTLQPYYDYDHNDISSQRARKNLSGENEYFYRCDLTNTGYASNSIYPQNIVFGFMSELDYWNITAIEEYLNRQVLVVTGETSDLDYAQKLQTHTFEMRFDLKTGILLDFKGFSSNGILQQYLTTTSFSVDEVNDELQELINDRITQFKSEYEN